MRVNSSRVAERRVPVLITWDVDPDRWASWEWRQRSLHTAMDLCQEFDIQSTFFFTANFAHEYPEELTQMQILGHEVGCHGLTHGDEEDYDRMSEEMQRDYIERASRQLETLVESPVQSFRGPRVKTSASALRLLAEYGYVADSSVCSQRIDFVSSNLINKGWIVAPRQPYRPHRASVFKRGETPIWEVPVSALVVPFISSSLNVFGLAFMQAFFKLLYMESKRTGKPIVYLAHPVELLGGRRHHFEHRELSLSYIRTHGFILRNLLFNMDGETWRQSTKELFACMASFPDVTFMTVGGYVRQELGSANRVL